MPQPKKVLFIDRDGTLIVEPPVDYQVDSLEKLRFVPGAITAMSRIATLGYELVMATNQDGLGTPSFPEETFHPAHNLMLATLAGEGIRFDEQLIDRSMPADNAPTRKPRTGMFGRYLDNPQYDLKASYVIGDRVTDIELAKNLGARGILLRPAEEGRRMLAEAGLTASAGISVNKMLAKIASDYRKPDGLFTIPPERIEEFVAGLPVERFFGIGEVTAEKMHRLGIRTGADLRLWNEAALVQQFGKAGHSYYGYARGIDEREVTPNRVRKSLGAETTFAEDTDDRERLRLELSAVREEVWNRVMRHEFRGKTVVLKLKFDNFRQITRSKTLFTPVDSAETLRRVSEELLAAADFHGRKIRLIGLTVGNSPEACPECVQLRFDFGNPEP